MTANWTIRPALPGDASAIVDIQIAGWQAGYRHLLPEDYLQGLASHREARIRHWQQQLQSAVLPTWIAEARGEPCGWIAAGPGREPTVAQAVGEIQALYLAPGHWRCGIGSALLRTALAALHGQGFRRSYLWVLVGNAKALAFYARHHFVADPSLRRSLHRGGVALAEVICWHEGSIDNEERPCSISVP